MRRTALLPLLLVPLLVSCSGAANDRAAKVPAPARAQAVSGPSVERTVIRTARIAVRVKDSRRAADAAVAVAGQRHGRVDSDERSEAGHGSATLVLRVPPAAGGGTPADPAPPGQGARRPAPRQGR